MDVRVISEFIESAAATIAVGRLIYLDLARRFPALLWYLTTLAVSNCVVGFLPQSSALYFWIYVAGIVPLECAFSILAVRELFSLVFSDYPGILTVGRWAMYAGVALATGLSVVLANVFWRKDARYHSKLLYLEVSQRSIVFSLVVVIATILFVLSRYPLHFSRNTYFSGLFFSLLFLTEAARLLIDSLAPHLYNHYVDGAGGIVIAVILSVWTVLLQPERGADISRVNASVPGETHLLEQLESLNEFLDSAGRR